MVRELRIDEIPDELKVLLPETAKKIIVVGSRAYEMYPMKEKMIEKISKDIVDLIGKIASRDAQCPKCAKIVLSAVTRRITECTECKEILRSTALNPIDAILSSGKVRLWVGMATDIEENETADMTLNQMKHFAGVFWEQNFSDDGLPKESQENFQKLLGMLGISSLAAKLKEAVETSE